jgi:Arc/MetJ-type ribon-helix-helix transcriptional regulator
VIGQQVSDHEAGIQAGRILEEQDRMREARLAQLRSTVREGLASGPGQPWDAAALKSEARAHGGSHPTRRHASAIASAHW